MSNVRNLPYAISVPILVALVIVLGAGLVSLGAMKDHLQERSRLQWLLPIALILLCVLLVAQSVVFLGALGQLPNVSISADNAWYLSYALWVVALAVCASLLALFVLKRGSLVQIAVDEKSNLKHSAMLASAAMYAVAILALVQGSIGLDLANVVSQQAAIAMGYVGAILGSLLLLGLLVGTYRVRKEFTIRLYSVL